MFPVKLQIISAEHIMQTCACDATFCFISVYLCNLFPLLIGSWFQQREVAEVNHSMHPSHGRVVC